MWLTSTHCVLLMSYQLSIDKRYPWKMSVIFDHEPSSASADDHLKVAITCLMVDCFR